MKTSLYNMMSADAPDTLPTAAEERTFPAGGLAVKKTPPAQDRMCGDAEFRLPVDSEPRRKVLPLVVLHSRYCRVAAEVGENLLMPPPGPSSRFCGLCLRQLLLGVKPAREGVVLQSSGVILWNTLRPLNLKLMYAINGLCLVARLPSWLRRLGLQGRGLAGAACRGAMLTTAMTQAGRGINVASRLGRL